MQRVAEVPLWRSRLPAPNDSVRRTSMVRSSPCHFVEPRESFDVQAIFVGIGTGRDPSVPSRKSSASQIDVVILWTWAADLN